MLTVLGSWRRSFTLLLVGVLAVALGGLQTRTASAASPAPVEIRLVSITSEYAAPANTPTGAVPTVLAVAGRPLTVTVSFFDSAGNPASFKKDTPISVTSGQGAVTSLMTLARKNATSAQLTVSVKDPVNRVRLRVAFTASRVTYADTAEDGERFDVLSELRVEPSVRGTRFEQGIGGDDSCSQATPQDPVCGVVILPTGATSPQVLLSLGACDPDPEPGDPVAVDYSGCGDERGSVVQVLAELTDYTATSPATIVMKCDKTLCGGGPIQAQVLFYTLGGNDTLLKANPCPAKNTMGPEDACVDYVQSKRDGSGDTHLYLLFMKDARVSVG